VNRLLVALALMLGARFSEASQPDEQRPSDGTCHSLDAPSRAEFDARALSTLLASGLGDLKLKVECSETELTLSDDAGELVTRLRTEVRLVDQLLELLTELVDARLTEPRAAAAHPTAADPALAHSVRPDLSPSTDEPKGRPEYALKDEPAHKTPVAPTEPIEPLQPEVPTPQASRSHPGVDATRTREPLHASQRPRPPTFRLFAGLASSVWVANLPGALGLELAEQTTWSEKWGFAVAMSALVGLSDAGEMRAYQLYFGGGPALRLTPWLSAEGGMLVSALLVPSPVPNSDLGQSIRPGGFLTLRAEKSTSFASFYGQLGLRVNGASRELKRGDELFQTIPFLEPTLGFGLLIPFSRPSAHN
jgi:hypothetical protein